MTNLFDTLMQAQNGQAMKAMTSQFGLSKQQTQSAIEALMPAFSAGLKQNASDPKGVAGFMQALSTGQHAQYFDDMNNAFQPQGIEEGNGILGHLFGSKEVSRAVATQAEQATGVGQDILKQMLPVIASTLMGGLFKQSTGQMHATEPAGGNFMAEMMEQMMQAQRQPSRAQQGGADNPFADVLNQMFGGGGQQSASNPMANNPWGKIFTEMMSGSQQAPQPQRRQSSGSAYEELFGQMFETGRQTQASYQKGIDDIFDQYLRGMIKHR